jgi:predicted RNase H-like HicB family nuclease
MDGYEVKIRYSPNDGCYVAEIVEFIGCATDGADPIEAYENLRAVKAEWIAAVESMGHPVPPPKYPAEQAA